MSWFFRKERTYTLLFEQTDLPPHGCYAPQFPDDHYPKIDACVVHVAKDLPRVGDTLALQLPSCNIPVIARDGGEDTKEARFSEFKFRVVDVEHHYHWTNDVIVGDRLLDETPKPHLIKLFMLKQGKEI